MRKIRNFRITVKAAIIFVSLFLKVRSEILYNSINLDPFKRLINDISDEMNPYQIFIFANKRIKHATLATEHIKRFLIQHFPTIIVDYQSIQILNCIMDYPSFGSPRYSTLFVMLSTGISPLRADRLSAVNKLLDDYVKILPRAIRPRWLTVLVKNESKERYKIELLLREAWRRKFLDFTILEIASHELDFNNTTIHYYNPFKNVYEATLYSNSVHLFPDKLHDMNGYGLNTAFFHEPPNCYLERNASGHIVSINGSDYWYILMTSRVLNFTIVTKPTKAQQYNDIFIDKNVIQTINSGELEFAGNQLYLWFKQHFERSMIVKEDGYCALVPNLHVPCIGITVAFYGGVLMTLVYVLFLVLIARFFGFDRNIWSWVNIYQVILGCSIPKHPHPLRERMLIGTIIFLSVSYSTVYYAKMTNKSLRKMSEVTFRSYRDLDKSGLIPLVSESFYNMTFHSHANRDRYLQNLKNRAQFWQNDNKCAEQMMRNKSLTCILSEALAHAMVDKYLAHDGTPTMQVMQPCFWVTWKGFGFTPGTPYSEKFDKIFLRIKESGLSIRWAEASKPRVKGLEKEDNSDVNSVQKQILFVLIIGYLLAGLVFFVELIVNSTNLNT